MKLPTSAALACALVGYFLCMPAFSSVSLEAKSPLGRFRGAEVRGSRLFPHIAYARPPVGKRRWRKPEPESSARQATEPVSCPQKGDDNFGATPLRQDEDCLYLNVWAPKEGTKHPVILWIHGGGLVAGSGLQDFYDGSIFARSGVVFVSINYRLHELGYGPNLEKEPGSLGLLDQGAALSWVEKNIEAFGGDPAKIYLMGHSKGAEAVTALLETGMAGPSVKGGIAMSNGRHFGRRNNSNFPPLQTQFLPGERDASWQEILKLKPEIGVYVPVVPRLRFSYEGRHRFRLLTSVLYDERFWGQPNEMYCLQAFFLKIFYDYIDAYFYVLHPGAYEHGDEVRAIFRETPFGRVWTRAITDFVKEGEAPDLWFAGRAEPFRETLGVTHLFRRFAARAEFRDEWKDTNCVHSGLAPGSQIHLGWRSLEAVLRGLRLH